MTDKTITIGDKSIGWCNDSNGTSWSMEDTGYTQEAVGHKNVLPSKLPETRTISGEKFDGSGIINHNDVGEIGGWTISEEDSTNENHDLHSVHLTSPDATIKEVTSRNVISHGSVNLEGHSFDSSTDISSTLTTKQKLQQLCPMLTDEVLDLLDQYLAEQAVERVKLGVRLGVLQNLK